jgi:hypothetical protein
MSLYRFSRRGLLLVHELAGCLVPFGPCLLPITLVASWVRFLTAPLRALSFGLFSAMLAPMS